MALIVVQAGHYPRKTGATGTGGLDGNPTEQDFTLAAANACARHLKAAGHRARVIWADPPDRNVYAGDVFVAIHCDGSTSSSARGASVGYRTEEGRSFAARFKRCYQAAGWTGGWRPDNYTAALAGYYGTRNAVNEGTRVAFIAEAGFLTNPGDERLLSGTAGPERFARALTAAVVEVFGGHNQEDDPLSALTNDQQLELLRKVREIWAETAANPTDAGECRLKDTTIRVRDLHERATAVDDVPTDR
jgi:N-acetylmuramoyl-L-alanine amidase